ncbi:hypothetical protein [Myxococcus sp. AS-1-15]|uniref:hypothetical protein n=1 Tax=Myxococcus sp. AS-1-15 TaxID=2874600 RepID=UPI001CC1B8B5|nr:hypothetical protein [Myxococcus sp. AS-1-15]MBZ4402538.1 hypothetical protein [Myxococcus sp. AS-1-15]
MTAVHLVPVQPDRALESLREQFPGCNFYLSGHITQRPGRLQPLCHADGSDCDCRAQLQDAHIDHRNHPYQTLPECIHEKPLVFQEQVTGHPVVMVERPGK